MEKVIESELMKDFNIVALPDKTKEIKEFPYKADKIINEKDFKKQMEEVISFQLRRAGKKAIKIIKLPFNIVLAVGKEVKEIIE